MTEEQIFKNLFPEYCVGEKCLSPYFDLFQIGFEEGEKQNEELKEKLESSEKIRDYWKESAFDWRHKFFEKRSTKRLVKKSKQLAKARDLILNLYNAGRDVLMCRNEELAYTRLDNAINDKRIEQFLKEVSE